MKNNFENNLPVINLYKKRSLQSEVDTQLLYGDNFKVIKKLGKWKKIKIKKDGYTGYIKINKLYNAVSPNFKVSVLKASIFSKPNLKKKLNRFLPYESRLRVIKKMGKFGKFQNYWIKISDLKKINYKHRNIFRDINIFKNTKYFWGGKSYKGIDCSALVQVALNYNNKYCPRDSKDQEKFFKRKVKLKNLRKNDMIFWKGHVAIALSKSKLIHAYGPMKKVVVMGVKRTIKRIKRTANLNVTSIRRI